MLLQFFRNDQLFKRGLSRFQRALAKVLAIAMVVVIIADTIQLLVVIGTEV